MTVKCVTQNQKNAIVAYYGNKSHNQKELAEMFRVSERTINRVLTEAGMATPVQRIKGEAYSVMQLLKKYALDFNQLQQLLKSHCRAIA